MTYDLEARTCDFFAAHHDLHPERILPFVAPDVHVEYVGALEILDHHGLERMLDAMHRNLAALGMQHMSFRLGHVGVRRNVTFAEWTCVVDRRDHSPTTYSGVHVISWNREGLASDVAVYTDPETIRRLAVGGHEPQPASAA